MKYPPAARIPYLSILILGLCLLCFPQYGVTQQNWESGSVYLEDGRLAYVSDEEGNRIPDFSHAGYRGGGVVPPDFANEPDVITLAPDEDGADDTPRIQAAIDTMGTITLDANGFRGVVLLTAGDYEIHSTIRINVDGVALRGEGNESTVLHAHGLFDQGNPNLDKSYRTVIIAGGGVVTGPWPESGEDAKANITTELVPVGARSFKVDDASAFQVGDNVIIVQPSTHAWLNAVNYGDTAGDPGWAPGEIDLRFNRYITEIHYGSAGDGIVIDAPVYDHLDRDLSQSYVHKFNRNNIKTHIGILDLQVDIQALNATDENHAWNAVGLMQIEDAWVSGVVTKGFVQAGVFTRNASRVSVVNSHAIEPAASTTAGSRRYNFNIQLGSNNVLFKNCHATNARHAYISNGTSSVSGIVFYNSTAAGDYLSSEGHRRWSIGLLFDGLTFAQPNDTAPGANNRRLGLYNRGDFGTAHGWSAAHSVAWRTTVPTDQKIVIQKPPTAQNYCIGCTGNVLGSGPFDHPAGVIEGANQPGLDPASLYVAQLQDRANGVPPSAPARLLATPGNNQVDLSWIDVAQNETGYALERSDDGGVTYSEITTVGVDATAYSDTTASGTVSYRLRAYNGNGNSAYSNPASATIIPSGVTARYVRIYAAVNRTKWGTEIEELRVFDANQTNLARDRPAAASSFRKRYPPNYAVDGDTGTRWRSKSGAPAWVYVDLGTIRPISAVEVVWRYHYAKVYEVQVSDDGVTWSTVFVEPNGDGGTDNISID